MGFADDGGLCSLAVHRFQCGLLGGTKRRSVFSLLRLILVLNMNKLGSFFHSHVVYTSVAGVW